MHLSCVINQLQQFKYLIDKLYIRRILYGFIIDNKNMLPTCEPLIAAISYDESRAIIGLLDEGVEHSVMLRKVLGTDKDIDKYYRIIFDTDGADWTFVCPVNYMDITNKEKRIERFYNDGYKTICKFLKEIGYPEIVEIPKRYRRHYNYLLNSDF